MNKESQFTIFLSYAWVDAEVANQIDTDFTRIGIKIIRDIRDINYKESIKNFMKRINKTDYVILLISRSYLESSNCMYEVLELLKDSEYKKRILPIILQDTNIFNPQGRLELIGYWEAKIADINSKTKNLFSLANISSITQDIDHFQKIRNSIDEFIKEIIDLNCKTLEELKNQKYKPILDLIDFSIEEIYAEMLAISFITDFEKRDVALHQLSIKYPNSYNVSYLKGYLALEREQWNLAFSYFSNLLSKNLNVDFNADLHIKLGRCYSGLQLYDKAIIEYNKAINIDPQLYMAYNNLGCIYMDNLPNFEKAKYNYDKALAIKPDDGQTHYNYALLLNDSRDKFNQPKNLDEIEYHYSESIKNYPTIENPIRTATVYKDYATFLYRNNDLLKSRSNFEICLNLNPRFFEAHCNYAVLLRKLKEFELAKKHYEIALGINPSDVISHICFANLLFENLHKYELADYHYKKAQEIDPLYMPENYIRFKQLTDFS